MAPLQHATACLGGGGTANMVQPPPRACSAVQALRSSSSSRRGTGRTTPVVERRHTAATISRCCCPDGGSMATEVVVLQATEEAATEHDEQQLWEQAEARQQQQEQQQSAQSEVLQLLHVLHGLCDTSNGAAQQPAAAAHQHQQLQDWAAAMQPHLPTLALSETAYIAACLRHHSYHCQQQQQEQQEQQQHFVAPPAFLQAVCAAAGDAASALLEQQQQQQALQQLLEVLQWAGAELTQQRRHLQQQLQHWQQQQQQQAAAVSDAGPEGGGAAVTTGPPVPAALPAYRQQIQQHAGAQAALLALLTHPLLVELLPRCGVWQLSQLLLCFGQAGHTPAFEWMGHWLAAARHSMGDLVLPFQQQQQYGGHHHRQQQQEYATAAAASYQQLVGLLHGLAAAKVRPPDAWLAAWQAAAGAALAARPCWDELRAAGSDSGSEVLSSVLQQLLTAVAGLKLRLSSEFWAAHEGMLAHALLSHTPRQLLRVTQLHQQAGLRPSKACIKYIAAQLEGCVADAWQQQQEQQQGQQQHDELLSACMCVCALSMWGVRLHMGAVAQLLCCLDARRGQLGARVILQVLATLGSRLGLVHNSSSSSDGWAASSNGSSSGSYSSTDGEEAPFFVAAAATGGAVEGGAAAVAGPGSGAAAAALERLLMFAVDELSPYYRSLADAQPDTAADCEASAGDAPGNDTVSGGRVPTIELRPLLQLLQVLSHLNRSSSSVASVTAVAVGNSDGPSSTTIVDRLQRRLQPLAAAAAPAASIQQLVLLMSGWAQLGHSSVWRAGRFRAAYKRLGQPGALAALTGDELAAAVAAMAKLPPSSKVVSAAAAEVEARLVMGQQQQQQQQGAQQEQQRAAPASPQHLTPSHLIDVVAAVPGFGRHWPPRVTLTLLQHVHRQGLVGTLLNPRQQWQLWSALQQLQQQWQPSVVAAAAAAAAAATGGQQGSSGISSGAAGEAPSGAEGLYATVSLYAAASAATAAAGGSSSRSSNAAAAPSGAMRFANLQRPSFRPAVAVDGTAAADASEAAAGMERTSADAQAHSQQRLLVLLDELQQQVADALSRVQPELDALPLNAAPPPRKAMQAGRGLAGGLMAATAASSEWDSLALLQPVASDAPADDGSSQPGSPVAAAAADASISSGDAALTQQQLLAAFAKAQKSLLSPRCSGPVLTHVLEGLVLLLAVPRYKRAAASPAAEPVRLGVLRALEATAWTDLTARTLDAQQLLLLLAASRGLGAPQDGPYATALAREATRVLDAQPLPKTAALLGRVAALNLPWLGRGPGWSLLLLRFWVARLAREAPANPEAVLAVLQPLVQLGFRPAGGAAALVLAPLLAAADNGSGAAERLPQRQSSSSGGGSDGGADAIADTDTTPAAADAAAALGPDSVMALTQVLADMGLRPHGSAAQQLLAAHVACVPRYSVRQLLLLARSVLSLGLLTDVSRDAVGRGAATGQQQQQQGASRVRLAPGAGAWVRAWLTELAAWRDITSLEVSQVVDLHLLLAELDLVPWFVCSHSPGIHRALQQLTARLAAAAPGWQGPLAATVQAHYQCTQSLRRIVAAAARKAAHSQPGQQQRPSPAAATASALEPAAAAAATNSSSSSGGGGSLFAYPSDALSHQLAALQAQRRVLLWAAVKHRVLGPVTEGWIESCCFVFLTSIHSLTPAVAGGLLCAVAEARAGSVAQQQQQQEDARPATPAATAESDRALRMRESALVNLTSALVGRVLVTVRLLRGGVLVQTLAELAAACVRAAPQRPGSTLAAAVAVAPDQHQQSRRPVYVLSRDKQQLLLGQVLSQLPLLRPSQLPLLVTSLANLGLRPDAAWLAAALNSLAQQAAAAAAADQPAQQLLLLAAAKQLLSCGGVLQEAGGGSEAAPAAGLRAAQGWQQPPQPRPAVPSTPAAGRSSAPRQPVAFALRSLTAAAAQVVGGLFRRQPQQQREQPVGSSQSQALAAAAAVAAAMGGGSAIRSVAAAGAGAACDDDSSASAASPVAGLLNSLAAQLQLSAQQQQLEGSISVFATAASPYGSVSSGWAVDAVLQQQGQPQQVASQQQVLAAAMLLQAGGGAAASPAAAGASGSGSERQMLSQLLRLQLQQVSRQALGAVQGDSTLPAAPASVLLPVQPLSLAPAAIKPFLKPQQEEEAEGLRQPGGLVATSARSLRLQLDGLLHKAFMAALAASSVDEDEEGNCSRSGMQQQQRGWLQMPLFGAFAARPLGAGSSFSSNAASSLIALQGARGSSSTAILTRPHAQAQRTEAAATNSIGEVGGVSTVSGGAGGAAVLPLLSRALDLQFARLMREVLASNISSSFDDGLGVASSSSSRGDAAVRQQEEEEL